MVEEEREIVHRAIEVTDDGKVTLREYVRTERVFFTVTYLNRRSLRSRRARRNVSIAVAKHSAAISRG